MTAIVDLLKAAEHFQKKLNPYLEVFIVYFKSYETLQGLAQKFLRKDIIHVTEMTMEDAQAIQELWNDTVLKEIYEKRNLVIIYLILLNILQFQLADNAK